MSNDKYFFISDNTGTTFTNRNSIMAASAKMPFNYYQNGKYGTLPSNPQKDVEVTGDMHLKMSKKIAQLTKVISFYSSQLLIIPFTGFRETILTCTNNLNKCNIYGSLF